MKTDAQLRGAVLKLLYEHRNTELMFAVGDGGFPIPSDIDTHDWLRACEQLAEKGLIHWQPMYQNTGGRRYLWFADVVRINAAGVDVVEGTSTPPIAVHIDQSQRIDVRDSQGVQIAGANSSQQQTIQDSFEHILQAIDSTKISPAEKEDARSTLRKLLESKALTAALGPVVAFLLKKYFPGSGAEQ
jgi:hypothetical protein